MGRATDGDGHSRGTEPQPGVLTQPGTGAKPGAQPGTGTQPGVVAQSQPGTGTHPGVWVQPGTEPQPCRDTTTTRDRATDRGTATARLGGSPTGAAMAWIPAACKSCPTGICPVLTVGRSFMLMGVCRLLQKSMARSYFPVSQV